LTAARPIPGYPEHLEHLGDHIFTRRLDLGLTRKHAATVLGTNGWTLKHWEENLKSRIEVRLYPAILSFLGYNPMPAATTRGEAIRRERVGRGWSRKHVAQVAGVDEATVRRLEADVPRTARRPASRVLGALRLVR
jgi:DNA-binding XRE family transcriptional regulator